MRVRVKICGITDEAAAIAAADAGADAVGFVFASSPRQVTAQRAAELASCLPSFVSRVAVFRKPELDKVREVIDTLRPDLIQSDNEDLPEIAPLAEAAGARLLPVFREGSLTEPLASELLNEGTQSGSGQPVDWEQAAAIARRTRMILAGGLNAENVARAIRQVRPLAVDVSSGVEAEPGRKSPRRIRAFVAAVAGSSEGEVL